MICEFPSKRYKENKMSPAFAETANVDVITAQGWRWSKCVTLPNFVAIGRTIAEIWRLFDFSRWRPPLSWIFKISNFYGRTIQESRTVSPCQISWGSVKPLPRYGDFFHFSKMAAVRHLGFVMRLFGPLTNGIWWSLSLCKIGVN